MMMPNLAGAVTITVNNVVWDITSLTTSYDANQDILDAQFWFGNRNLAREFAQAYIDQVPDGTASVNFLHTVGSFAVAFIANPNFTDLASRVDRPNLRRNYAIGRPLSPIPLPGAFVLLGAGLAGLAGLGRRKRPTT